ncbi:Lysozyme g [Triplophysa tibetana]|uniref:Lysozyme g n=1 Tax=Triplophysa tibetana TaxID=1572043 RepID=A0A5A9NID6_9TELE|nr:Lysozyme g [Triplophysa tibetana]
MACIYGNIMKIDTTGASENTAKPDNLPVTGVEASRKMAENDLAHMEKYKSLIIKVGKAKKMEPSVIAAIISRETRANPAFLSKDGFEREGNGFGLMQVDKRYHDHKGTLDSEEHLLQATQILIDFIHAAKKKFPGWTQEQCFKGGIAGYNCGKMEKVKSYQNVDRETTRHDYSNDVVARAQLFNTKGY